MKSWKARLLILATMLAMLIALAAPAVAHDADFEEAYAYCLYWEELDPEDEEFWDCVEAYLAWHDDDDHDDSSADDGSADDGSAGDGSSYWEPYLYAPYYY